mgnify:CR=1 FL=1
MCFPTRDSDLALSPIPEHPTGEAPGDPILPPPGPNRPTRDTLLSNVVSPGEFDHFTSWLLLPQTSRLALLFCVLLYAVDVVFWVANGIMVVQDNATMHLVLNMTGQQSPPKRHPPTRLIAHQIVTRGGDILNLAALLMSRVTIRRLNQFIVVFMEANALHPPPDGGSSSTDRLYRDLAHRLRCILLVIGLGILVPLWLLRNVADYYAWDSRHTYFADKDVISMQWSPVLRQWAYISEFVLSPVQLLPSAFALVAAHSVMVCVEDILADTDAYGGNEESDPRSEIHYRWDKVVKMRDFATMLIEKLNGATSSFFAAYLFLSAYSLIAVLLDAFTLPWVFPMQVGRDWNMAFFFAHVPLVIYTLHKGARLSVVSQRVAVEFEKRHMTSWDHVKAYAPLVAHLRATTPVFAIYSITITEEKLVTLLFLVLGGVWSIMTFTPSSFIEGPDNPNP